jgi:hypothetical protein
VRSNIRVVGRIHKRRSRTLVIALTIASLSALVGCGTKSPTSSPKTREAGTGGPDELFAEVASFEIVSQRPQRIMVGLSTVDSRVLHGGQIELTLTPPVGSKNVSAFTVGASFLPVPGSATPAGSASIGLPSDGIGVYRAEATFPTDGIWNATVNIRGVVTQTIDEIPLEIRPKSLIPDVGDPAPKTKNPITSSPLASSAPVKIDSRSGPQGLGNDFADATLHQHVIADLLAAKKPFVVVVSTPAFCQSKFCGPLTDLIQKRAEQKSDGDVVFVHLEVWDDFSKSKVNPWAAEWIDDGIDGREPWVFSVNRNGIVAARYDNIMSPADLDAAVGQAG